MNKHIFSFLSWLTITVTTCWLNLSLLWAEHVIRWNIIGFLLTGLFSIGLTILYATLYGPRFRRGEIDWSIYLAMAILTGFILGILTTEWLTRWTDIIPVLP